MLCIFAGFSIVSNISRVFRICCAYVQHMLCIFCAFPVPAHFFRKLFKLVPHIFRMCFTLLRICYEFPVPIHLFRIYFTIVPHVFSILSSEKRIVFRICCAFRIFCAYVCASQNAFFCISKFPNMTLRFHRLSVAILILIILLVPEILINTSPSTHKQSINPL
jgi:hypothetical protein